MTGKIGDVTFVQSPTFDTREELMAYLAGQPRAETPQEKFDRLMAEVEAEEAAYDGTPRELDLARFLEVKEAFMATCSPPPETFPAPFPITQVLLAEQEAIIRGSANASK